MNKLKICVFLILILAVGLIPHAAPAQANSEPFTRIDGEIRGYPYTLFRPDDWNGDLVLLVHGSVPWWFEIFGPILAEQGYGVGYATFGEDTGPGFVASFKEVPLLTRFVQAQFTARFGAPERTYLYAFSRGAIHSLKLLETSPARYDGVISACGANAGAPAMNQYSISTRVLFDYFYPGVIPGTPLESPVNSLMEFGEHIAPLIIEAVSSYPEPARKLARTNFFNLPDDLPLDELIYYILESQMILVSIVNNMITGLGGNPFDNTGVVYSGSDDDEALNAGVARFSADPHALHYLRVWSNPSGDLGKTPFLSLYGSLDGTGPEWYVNGIFQELVDSTGSGDYYVHRVVDRPGHCNFTLPELLGGLENLVNWVETGVRPAP